MKLRLITKSTNNLLMMPQMKYLILLKKPNQKISLNKFVNKPKIRNKIIKIRKKKFYKDFKIDLVKFISFLKINKLNFKSICGYYPSNY